MSTVLIYGSHGEIIGEKTISDLELLAPLLNAETACQHGAYKFGIGRSADGGLRLICTVCGEKVAFAHGLGDFDGGDAA